MSGLPASDSAVFLTALRSAVTGQRLPNDKPVETAAPSNTNEAKEVQKPSGIFAAQLGNAEAKISPPAVKGYAERMAGPSNLGGEIDLVI